MTETLKVAGIQWDYDSTYEMCFDGELGSTTSLDAHGHLSEADAELFMATAVAEEFYETLDFGLEIEHLWRSEHPFDWEDEHDRETMGERWTYEYDEAETPGSIAVTRFQVASPWASASDARTRQETSADAEALTVSVAGISQRVCPSCGGAEYRGPSKWGTELRCASDECRYTLPQRKVMSRRRDSLYARREDFNGWADRYPLMCVNHPDEPAVTGYPETQVVDGEEKSIDGSVHMCQRCSQRFTVRLAAARQRALAPLNIARFLDGATETDAEWVDKTFAIPFTQLKGLIEQSAESLAWATDFIKRWQAAYPEKCVLGKAPGNFAILNIRDLEGLVEQDESERP